MTYFSLVINLSRGRVAWYSIYRYMRFRITPAIFSRLFILVRWGIFGSSTRLEKLAVFYGILEAVPLFWLVAK